MAMEAKLQEDLDTNFEDLESDAAAAEDVEGDEDEDGVEEAEEEEDVEPEPVDVSVYLLYLILWCWVNNKFCCAGFLIQKQMGLGPERGSTR